MKVMKKDTFMKLYTRKNENLIIVTKTECITRIHI